jgi:hypothetical protein
MTPREKLIQAYENWFIHGDDALNPMTWAAVRDMQTDLPPAGPDEVEIEVQGMFEEDV